jgi:3-hydroxybutyryl-CoA dehydrogenase
MGPRTVAIVGAGTMGAGIAQVALEAGWRARLTDASAPALESGRTRIQEGLTKRAARVTEDAEERRAWVRERLDHLELAVPGTEPDEITAGVPLVIEAALEDLDLKLAVFRDLDLAAAPETLLATNTSALSVSKIADATRRPWRVLGLHFFNPAPLLPLVEVVTGDKTADAVAEEAADIMSSWGKTPIRTADAPGFIVNRVNRPFTLEPLRLLHAGAGTVESIDEAIVAAGFPMGPFRLMDLIGIDINLAAARSLFQAFDRAPRFRPSPIQESLVTAGRLGRKTGEGFYRYDGAAKAIGPAAEFAARRPGPEVGAALDAESIAERTILAIVAEAYRAVGDRVAAADDIDQAMRLGANHPFGPFEWARRTGVTEVAAMLDNLSDEDADTFRPALTLLRAAARER